MYQMYTCQGKTKNKWFIDQIQFTEHIYLIKHVHKNKHVQMENKHLYWNVYAQKKTCAYVYRKYSQVYICLWTNMDTHFWKYMVIYIYKYISTCWDCIYCGVHKIGGSRPFHKWSLFSREKQYLRGTPCINSLMKMYSAWYVYNIL